MPNVELHQKRYSTARLINGSATQKCKTNKTFTLPVSQSSRTLPSPFFNKERKGTTSFQSQISLSIQVETPTRPISARKTTLLPIDNLSPARYIVGSGGETSGGNQVRVPRGCLARKKKVCEVTTTKSHIHNIPSSPLPFSFLPPEEIYHSN
jgi:hypothetical protein